MNIAMPHTLEDTKKFRRHDVYGQHAELAALRDVIDRLQFILEVIRNNDPRIVEIAEQALSRKTG